MTDFFDLKLDYTEVARGYLRCSDSLSSQSPDGDEMWTPETDPDQRAYDLVNRTIREGSAEHAWKLVLAILEQAPDDRLAHQAAGPLEDLVRHRGAEVIEQLEESAARSERFQWALGQIWVSADNLPPQVVRRLVAASGDVIEPI